MALVHALGQPVGFTIRRGKQNPLRFHLRYILACGSCHTFQNQISVHKLLEVVHIVRINLVQCVLHGDSLFKAALHILAVLVDVHGNVLPVVRHLFRSRGQALRPGIQCKGLHTVRRVQGHGVALSVLQLNQPHESGNILLQVVIHKEDTFQRIERGKAGVSLFVSIEQFTAEAASIHILHRRLYALGVVVVVQRLFQFRGGSLHVKGNTHQIGGQKVRNVAAVVHHNAVVRLGRVIIEPKQNVLLAVVVVQQLFQPDVLNQLLFDCLQ